MDRLLTEGTLPSGELERVGDLVTEVADDVSLAVVAIGGSAGVVLRVIVEAISWLVVDCREGSGYTRRTISRKC